MDFTDKEKIALFDRISENYFNRNFGTMLKADVDTMIFSAYIEHCLNNGLPYDDYTLSIQLGLTEARVRSLKERKQLRYPYEDYHWKEAFIQLIPNAKYSEAKKLVQMNIGDVNLIKDVRNYVYSHGWFDEFQLNPKLFQCRVDYFISLCNSFENSDEYSDETKAALKALAKNDKERSAIEKILTGSFEEGMTEIVKDISKEAMAELLKLIPFGGLAGKAVASFIRILT